MGVGPFSESGLDETLCLAVGFWGVGFGANVPDTELLARPGEGTGFVARAVVGHNALDLDAQALIVGDGSPEEGCSAALLFVGLDLREGEAGGIVDADMDKFPAHATRVALPFAVACDAMTGSAEPPELLDIDVDQFAGILALVASHGLGWLQIAHPAQTQTMQNPADRGWRHTGLERDLLACPAPAAQGFNLLSNGVGCRSVQAVRPGRSIHQATEPLGPDLRHPLAGRAFRHAHGIGNNDGRLPFVRDAAHQFGSTMRRQTGILMHVHPVLPGKTDVSATSVSPVRTG